MSKTNAETALALFERTNGRGDVLSIHLEDGAKLAALPKVMFAEIAYPLFQWWVHGTYAEPTDPRDKMVFEGLKAHQIENAVKRGVNLKNWAENASKGGRPKSSKKPSGNQAETKRVQLQVREEVQVEDSSTSLQPCTSSSVDGAGRGGLTPPDCPSISVEEAEKTIAMYAPAISTPEHKKLVLPSGNPNLLVYEFANAKTADALLLTVAEKLYPDDIDTKDEEIAAIMDGDEHFADNDLPKKFYKSDGGRFIKDALAVNDAIYEVFATTDGNNADDKANDLFGRALADGYLSALAKNAANPAGWILARLKKVLEAVKTLEGAKGDQKPPTEAAGDGDDWD